MSAEFRQLLEEGDVAGLRSAWSRLRPGMPQPQSHGDAEIVMHLARTAAQTVTFRLRAYSHRWLTERSIPSQLPDRFRPRAERMYPQVVEAVAVGVRFSSPWMQPAAVEVRGAMNAAIEDCFANGDRDPAVVSAQMARAKEDTMKALFGKR